VSKKNGWCVINYYTVINAVNAGYKVFVFTDQNADNLKIQGATYFPVLPGVGKIGRRPFQFLKNIFLLKKIIRKEKPDIVHVLVEPYLIYFSLLPKCHLILTIVGTYAISIFEKSRFQGLYQMALRKVVRIVSISDYTAARFRKLNNYRGSIDVIRLGVDFESFSRTQIVQNIQREMAFCFVGHIKPRKGLIYALRAMKILQPLYSDVKFYVAGLFEDKSYSESCLKYVQENGLQNSVKFLGRLPHEDVKALYAKSILNLLPSYNSSQGSFEGFGLIHLEANAASTLTLGSKNSGNESAIVDGVTGFLVEQENERELAEKMARVIEIYKKGEYDRYAKSCIDYAKANSWEKYFKQLNEKYLETI
jgi:glycosyltransferase involved in cell wall biosynthesis